MARKTNQIIDPFTSVPAIPMIPADQRRFGNIYERTFRELQVGDADKASSSLPKIMRVDRQGLWLGAHRFGDPFNRPSRNGLTAPFRVDMEGNVIAESLQTSLVGQRIQIINNRINFYASNNTLSGSIFGTPGFLAFDLSDPLASFAFQRGGVLDFVLGSGAFPSLLINTAGGNLIIRDGGVQFLTQVAELYADGIGSITASGVFSLPQHASAPTFGGERDGSMYYDTTLAKARVRESGVWVNIV